MPPHFDGHADGAPPAHPHRPRRERQSGEPLRIGVGGPVGSGKTALVAALCRMLRDELSVAVRSSATAEDLPTASFAGQQVIDWQINVGCDVSMHPGRDGFGNHRFEGPPAPGYGRSYPDRYSPYTDGYRGGPDRDRGYSGPRNFGPGSGYDRPYRDFGGRGEGRGGGGRWRH